MRHSPDSSPSSGNCDPSSKRTRSTTNNQSKNSNQSSNNVNSTNTKKKKKQALLQSVFLFGLFMWFASVLFNLQLHFRVDVVSSMAIGSFLRHEFNVSSSASVSSLYNNNSQQPQEQNGEVSTRLEQHVPDPAALQSAMKAIKGLTSDRHRYFGRNPITEEESDALSLLRNSSSGLRLAVCHPTIHYDSEWGNLTTLDKFFLWVSYYRLLGFDHIFLWHLPVIRERSQGFEQLRSLPYVTLTEVDKPGGKQYFGQLDVMRECLRNENYAKNYDWALLVDADEFLWYNVQHMENPGKSNKDSGMHPLLKHSQDGKRPPFYHIKDWLIGNGYQEKYNYISFGKSMFTLMHSYVGEGRSEEDYLPPVELHPDNQTNATTTGAAGKTVTRPPPRRPFGDLERFPFTAGAYCYQRRDGKGLSCPDWKGRCKILMNPLQRGQGGITVHGYSSNINKPRSIHMDTSDVAHVKEWTRWLQPPPNVTKRATKQDFFVSSTDEVLTHSTMESHPKNKQGQVKFSHDNELVPWLDALHRGFPDSPNLLFHRSAPSAIPNQPQQPYDDDDV